MVGFQTVLSVKTISLLRFQIRVRACICVCRLGPGGPSVNSEHVPEVSFTSNYPVRSFNRIKLDKSAMSCYAAVIGFSSHKINK